MLKFLPTLPQVYWLLRVSQNFDLSNLWLPFKVDKISKFPIIVVLDTLYVKIHNTGSYKFYIQGVPQNITQLFWWNFSASYWTTGKMLGIFERPTQFCVEKCIKPFLYLKKWPRYEWIILEFWMKISTFQGLLF